MDTNEPSVGAPVPKKKISLEPLPLRAVIRMTKKIRTKKNGCVQLDLSGRRSADSPKTSFRRQNSVEKPSFKSSNYEKPNIFKFDTPTLAEVALNHEPRRPKRKRSRHVLYPGNARRYLPVEQKSKAKRCLLLFIFIVGFQILNAIENLDDNVLKYDLDGLEKNMKREVFGQPVAIEKTITILKDYLATHYHNKPLVISFNGPSGVGKSHMGRLLAKHFRSVMDDDFILQYYVRHKCPKHSDVPACKAELSGVISHMISQAEIEEKIPVFIFDEMEAMPPVLLDVLQGYFQLNQTNEYLNAVYILISSLGGNEITRYVLQNATNIVHDTERDLTNIVSSVLGEHHPLWKVAEIVPFVLLEKKHVVHCFLDELLQEGFYPDTSKVESLAGEISYYTKEGTEYSVTGCKQVVGRVNLLHPPHTNTEPRTM
ncbi:torsin-4A [Spea bombifrons]|uniref:torsin-4A n=1 Tax=Spea bombifrons TaxID=233779 RepID=UPI002348FB06|nr:torsin-4A [Spea bombifrons]XP_053328319.1 torsin-4A [Spea bombifrons]